MSPLIKVELHLTAEEAEKLSDTCGWEDEGPEGEGWKSPELESLVNKIEQALIISKLINVASRLCCLESEDVYLVRLGISHIIKIGVGTSEIFNTITLGCPWIIKSVAETLGTPVSGLRIRFANNKITCDEFLTALSKITEGGE